MKLFDSRVHGNMGAIRTAARDHAFVGGLALYVFPGHNRADGLLMSLSLEQLHEVAIHCGARPFIKEQDGLHHLALWGRPLDQAIWMCRREEWGW